MWTIAARVGDRGWWPRSPVRFGLVARWDQAFARFAVKKSVSFSTAWVT